MIIQIKPGESLDIRCDGGLWTLSADKKGVLSVAGGGSKAAQGQVDAEATKEEKPELTDAERKARRLKMIEACKKVVTKKGKPALVALFGKLGAGTFNEVAEDKYPQLVQLIKGALK